MKFTEIDRHSSKLWPKGRSGHRMCADDNYLYLFGGYNPNDDHAIYTELWRFNTSSKTWMVLPDKENMAPKAGASLSMIYFKRKIITFGGTGYPFAVRNSEQLSMYCLVSFRWYNLSKLARDKQFIENHGEAEIKVKHCGCTSIKNLSPLPKYGQSLAVSPAGKVYVFAGTSGTEFENDLHSFCLKSLTWTQHNFCHIHRECLPLPRYRHEVISDKEQFYVFGGATSHRIYGFNRIQSYEYGERAWSSLKCSSTVKRQDIMEFPEPRQSHLCLRHGNKVYLIGGLTVLSRALNDVWTLDLKEKCWSRLKVKFCYPVFFHSGAITNHGCIYTFGGTNQANKRVDDLHQCQLEVQSLKRLAWMLVAERLQENHALNKKSILELGVPKNFVEWIDDADAIQAA